MNASTGEITVKSGANIDYESSDKSYSITISVTDGEDASGEAESPPTTDATTSVRIEVINIDDPGLSEGGGPHVAILGRSFLRNYTISYEGRTGQVVISNDSPPDLRSPSS